jgi:AbrB family looped-hinge helix DNA binding protein
MVIHILIKSNTEVIPMDVVKATVKGQILIPASLRRKYQIERGTPLRVYGRRNRIILEPLVRDLVEEGRGMLKTKGRILKSLIEDRKREAKQ